MSKPSVPPTVPQFLAEREAERGCRSNRRLDPHKSAMAAHHERPVADTRTPSALRTLALALAIVGFYLGVLGAWVVIVGHLLGWWRLF